MGASVNDTCFTVISNGEKAYYSSFKGMGNLLWDVNCGLFDETGKKPDAHHFFDFLKKEKNNWDFEDIIFLDEPLEKPVYGIITVDFDRKEIMDDNGYGCLYFMFQEWFEDSVNRALNNQPAYVSNKSIKYHLKNENIYFAARDNKVHSFLPKTVEQAAEVLKNMPTLKRIEEDILWIGLRLPQSWKYITPEDSE